MGGLMASPQWRFCGLGRGLGSNKKVEMTLSARLGEGRTGLICVFLPWLCLMWGGLEPCGALVGVGLSCVRYPILGSSQPEGLSFVACPDRSCSSDALGEFANGYDRVESGFVICDGAGIALL